MEALGSLTQFLSSGAGSSLFKIGELGLTGAGLAGNISAEKQQQDAYNLAKKQEQTLPDPTALAKQVSAATQPLNAGLVQGVENTVSGNLAEQGLSQAPGIQAATLAQALAPFEQQNQQQALQLVLTRLGLPLSYIQTMLANQPKQTNLSPLLALLTRQNNPSPTGTGGSTSLSTPNDFLNLTYPQTSQAPPPDTGGFDLPSDVWA